MDQNLINWFMAGFGALIGFILKAIWDEIKSLQVADVAQTAKLAGIEILVAGDYVKRDAFEKTVEALFKKLDKIDDKLDGKADK